MGYNALMFPEFHIGDVVRMRKMHPCGGFEWKIYRLGADIGLECLTCQHRVFLSRRELAHKLKALVSLAPVDEAPKEPENSGCDH